VQVARPRPSPLSLPARTPARPVLIPPGHTNGDRHQDHGPGHPAWPLPAVTGLDDVLGPGPGDRP